MNFILQLLITAVGVVFLAWLFPGIEVSGYGIALLVAVVIALLRVIVKPILVILTLPVTILTFGLFLLVINAVIILLADSIVSGFSVANFWWALLFGVVLAIWQSVFFRK